MTERASRRRFVQTLVVGAGSLAAAPLGSQSGAPPATTMSTDAYRPVLRPAKPGATPQVTDDQRDALEHKIKCQCGCILDVYTCRTTDFTCSTSPAMHRDVMRLIAGGYTEQEILDAFVETYGEVALTAPKKEGFNWAGYFAPGVVLAVGGIALTVLLRKWRAEAQRSAVRAPIATAGAALPGVSADALAQLDRAIREEG
ncbi:MAG: cytochrome c-type biogenesis protein [Gemmatimonadaceae bacterium]